jgi:hypothetical protein
VRETLDALGVSEFSVVLTDAQPADRAAGYAYGYGR